MGECPWCGHAGSDHGVTQFRGKTRISIACIGCQPYLGRRSGPCKDSARYQPDGWNKHDMEALRAPNTREDIDG